MRSLKLVYQLQALETPPGTVIHLRGGMGVVENLNKIVADLQGDWLWCQADDHVWDPGILARLLARDVDVIVPLMTRRSPPFSPLIYKARHDDGYEPYRWDELPTEGLVPVWAAASGGMLIRRHVIDRVLSAQGHGYLFEYEDGRHLREDLYLCEKIHKFCPEVEIYADMEAVQGHVMANTEVWPTVGKDGNWEIMFDMGVDEEGRHSLVSVRG